MANSSSTKPHESLFVFFALVLVTACLYWARTVLIPLALAILLAFVLTPAVAALQRRGLGRLPAVLLVVILALMLLSAIGYIVTRQINTLVANLPRRRSDGTSGARDPRRGNHRLAAAGRSVAGALPVQAHPPTGVGSQNPGGALGRKGQ